MSGLRWVELAVVVACAIGAIALIRWSPELRREPRAPRTPAGRKRESPDSRSKRDDPNCCQVCGRAVPLLSAEDIKEPPWPGGRGWLVNTGESTHEFATRVCRDCWTTSENIEAALRREAAEAVHAKAREAAVWLAHAPVIDKPSHALRADRGWETYPIADAARQLGRFTVYGQGKMGYNTEDEDLAASYRDGVARPGFDEAQGCYVYYAGSVFRTADGQIAVQWRETRREYPD